MDDSEFKVLMRIAKSLERLADTFDKLHEDYRIMYGGVARPGEPPRTT